MGATIDTNERRQLWSPLSIALLLIAPMLAVPAMGQGSYTITALTSGPTNHEWPSVNDSGTVVWSQQEPGSCVGGQCWQVFEQVLNGQPQQVTSDAHNHSYPAIDDNGDIMYLKDGEGAGPGLEVVELVSGVENQIEFSSGSPPGCTEPPAGPPTCTSWRAAGQSFGIGDGNAQIVSYHDFCSPSCTRTFDVSGFGVFTALPATAVALDINANGDIAYDDGTGTIYEVNLTSQLPIKVAPGTLPRINDLGDIVLVAKGQVQVWFHPNYAQHAVVNSTTTAIWADINNAGVVAFEDVDASSYHQVFQATPAPAATLSPKKLNFGTQLVGTASALKTATLINTGIATLDIYAIATAGEFSESNTCGSTLAPNANCIFDVVFKPTAIGTESSELSITDNASDSPQKVTLTGTGTYVQLTPTSLNFGDQTVGTASAAKTVTLKNTGITSLSITSVTFTGTNASDFGETNSCGSGVAAGKTCTINVTFTPTAQGARSASLAISDNGGGSPQTVKLNGTGTYVQLTPASLNFGNQTVGTTSTAKTVTLKNTGTTALSITSISVTGTNAGDFAETNTCGPSLAAGKTCTISATFTPTAKGARSASVAVNDNSPGSPQTVPLTGTGT